jgi:hypothetical protein
MMVVVPGMMMVVVTHSDPHPMVMVMVMVMTDLDRYLRQTCRAVRSLAGESRIVGLQ